jgi:hypothetical protein
MSFVLAAALGLSACTGEQATSEAPESPAATSEVTTPTGTSSAKVPAVNDSAPTATASPSGSGNSGSVSEVAFNAPVENADGYTGEIVGTVMSLPYEISYENAKPGFADLVRPSVVYDLGFANTTPQRSAPSLTTIKVAAAYPAGSPTCEAYKNGAKLNEFNTDEPSPYVRLGAKHCFVEILTLETGIGAQTEAGVGEVLPYGMDGMSNSEAHESLNTLHGVPEAEAQRYMEAVSTAPVGYILWSGSQSSYDADLTCAGLPEIITGDESASYPPARPGEVPTILQATGGLC